MVDNGLGVQDQLGQTINIDDLAGQSVQLEIPGRVEGVPEVRAKVPRRVDLPDDEHYIMVLGGGSNRERVWFQAVQGKAQELRDAKVPSAQIELWVMSQWATFVADRVVDHNLEYGPGDPLPTGIDLVWELGYIDSMSLMGMILSPPRLFADPKAAATSSTTSPDGDSSQ